MDEFLSNIYANSTTPIVSALVLGLMTAISPCPLATNITAMGFISKDIENKNRIFLKGIFYTLGRAFSYTLLAVILFFGASRTNFKAVFEQYGEKILGPALIIIGLFMLGLIKFNLSGNNSVLSKFQNKSKHSYFDGFLLGAFFALTFCPYSGILFFGMLIPITIKSASGLFLPIIYAIATGIPVIIFAWILAYSISGIGKLYNRIKSFETWFRKIVALVFIGTGIYYCYLIWFQR